MQKGNPMQRNNDITKAIGYIDIRVFAHATEDPEKVQTAVRNLLPTDLAQTLVFETTACTGHHGNSIILFTAKLTDRKLLPTALEKFGSQISALDKEELNREIKLHLEKGNLYLRFDKQSAFLGALRFSQHDPVHIKIHFRNKTAEEIIEICKKNGLLP
jgi:RNA binding exosome subunit